MIPITIAPSLKLEKCKEVIVRLSIISYRALISILGIDAKIDKGLPKTKNSTFRQEPG
jgi:hypothetical protein